MLKWKEAILLKQNTECWQVGKLEDEKLQDTLKEVQRSKAKASLVA